MQNKNNGVSGRQRGGNEQTKPIFNMGADNKHSDTYYLRKAIFKAIEEHISKFSGTVLDVGCGEMPYKSLLLSPPSKATTYIGLDLKDNPIYNKVKPDLVWNGESIPLTDGFIDCAVATEIFEHCVFPEIVMREINRVLKPAGILFFSVPFLWPLHDVPNDQYRYTPFSLERHLKNSKFEQVEIKALGGWDASLSQMLGLWINRRPFSVLKKNFLKILILPLIRFLNMNDVIPNKFCESTMVTGYYGIAKKAANNNL